MQQHQQRPEAIRVVGILWLLPIFAAIGAVFVILLWWLLG